MANPYGITLKPAWTEWAAKLGVSETIAAAVYLLGEARNAEDVVDKLNPGEIERVIDIIGHQPDRFPPGDPQHEGHTEAKEWADEYDPDAVDELPIKYALSRIANRRNAARVRIAKTK